MWNVVFVMTINNPLCIRKGVFFYFLTLGFSVLRLAPRLYGMIMFFQSEGLYKVIAGLAVLKNDLLYHSMQQWS